MNSRERVLAIILLGVILLGGGGFFGYQFVYSPWITRTRMLANLKKEEQAKLERLDEIDRDRSKLARWRALSLPADPNLASVEYEKYLNGLLQKHSIINGRNIAPQKQDNSKTAPTTTDKQPIYTRLSFTVHAYATMDSIVGMLHDFYSTGLMQQIKSLKIQRQMTVVTGQRTDELELNMLVEALIVSGTDPRPYLLPNFDRRLLALDMAASPFPHPGMIQWAAFSPGLAPRGLLADPERDYKTIARKNIFLGRTAKTGPIVLDDGTTPQWMAPRFVHLTDITRGTLRMEATVYDVSTNQKVPLKGSSSYASDFPFIRDGESMRVISGFVVKIDDRELVFRADFAASDDAASRDAKMVRLNKAEREALVTDSTISLADADVVIRVRREYWDWLVKQQVIKMSAGGSDKFMVYLERDQDKPAEDPEQSQSVKILQGKVLYQDNTYAYVRPEERYYRLHIGESLEDALKKPIEGDELKKLKKELADN
jgi:hypothetical protein